ncbi:MAG: hypothetical protein ACRC0X_04915 [Brevinema sp.]
MPSKEALFNQLTKKKHLQFFSLVIPLFFSLWINTSLFFFYLNSRDFSTLPQNLREEHITSLFFRTSTWNFPITLLDSPHIPLSLTDNIPLMAIIFKIFDLHSSHYFGTWVTLSALFYAFFAYRICKDIFKEESPTAIGLSTLLFLMIPFIWYHSIHVAWLAGHWIILWAYSLYFKRKPYTSSEWFGVMIISSMIHPYFTFVCFLIMVADIVHLYIYNHSISSVQAAASFGHLFTSCFLTMATIGVLYLPTFSSSSFIPPLTFYQSPDYNISFLHLGYGILFGLLAAFFLIALYAKQLRRTLHYYRALGGTLLIFFFCGTIGGIQFTKQLNIHLPMDSWLYQWTGSLFTSGPKFFIPILLIAPIIITSTAYRLEQYRKHLGTAFLIALIVIQVTFLPWIDNNPKEPFKELDVNAQQFLSGAEQLKWIFSEEIPLRPPSYEKLAYYAYQNNITINAAPVIRFPSRYQQSLSNEQSRFLNQDFEPKTVYILSQQGNPYVDLGQILIVDEVILFKIP